MTTCFVLAGVPIKLHFTCLIMQCKYATTKPPHLFWSFNLKQCAMFRQGLLLIASWIAACGMSLSVLHTKSCLEHSAGSPLPCRPSPCQVLPQSFVVYEWMNECMHAFCLSHCTANLVLLNLTSNFSLAYFWSFQHCFFKLRLFQFSLFFLIHKKLYQVKISWI